MYFTTCIDIVLLTPRSERVKSSNHGGGMTVWGGCEEVCVDGCFDIHVNFFLMFQRALLQKTGRKDCDNSPNLSTIKNFFWYSYAPWSHKIPFR